MTDSLTIHRNLTGLLPVVADAVTSPHTRRAYTRALRRFLAWYVAQPDQPTFCRATVQSYRGNLELEGVQPSSINQALSAIRKLASEAAANGWLDETTARGILELPGLKQRGRRTGNWLTRQQVKKLLEAPNRETLAGKRDRALLGLLVGCGLRRDEAARLEVWQIQEREGRPILADLLGKGRRTRTVAVPRWLAPDLAAWVGAAQITAGPLLRPLTKAGRLGPNGGGAGISASGIWWVVRHYAQQLGLEIAPHDLRRTFSELARKGGADLHSIQTALGHSSVQTTERYLNGALDLEDPACDYLRLEER